MDPARRMVERITICGDEPYESLQREPWESLQPLPQQTDQLVVNPCRSGFSRDFLSRNLATSVFLEAKIGAKAPPTADRAINAKALPMCTDWGNLLKRLFSRRCTGAIFT
jgi:hypothetical protein